VDAALLEELSVAPVLLSLGVAACFGPVVAEPVEAVAPVEPVVLLGVDVTSVVVCLGPSVDEPAGAGASVEPAAVLGVDVVSVGAVSAGVDGASSAGLVSGFPSVAVAECLGPDFVDSTASAADVVAATLPVFLSASALAGVSAAARLMDLPDAADDALAAASRPVIAVPTFSSPAAALSPAATAPATSFTPALKAPAMP